MVAVGTWRMAPSVPSLVENWCLSRGDADAGRGRRYDDGSRWASVICSRSPAVVWSLRWLTSVSFHQMVTTGEGCTSGGVVVPSDVSCGCGGLHHLHVGCSSCVRCSLCRPLASYCTVLIVLVAVKLSSILIHARYWKKNFPPFRIDLCFILLWKNFQFHYYTISGPVLGETHKVNTCIYRMARMIRFI
jgi:hypothetical protein